MPVFSVWMLDESQISISGGEELSGYTQGDGSHLDGLTITLNSNAWTETFVRDNDSYFEDNRGGGDRNQRLDEEIEINGQTYSANARVEAEYQLTVQDPDGNTYTLIGYNINEAGSPYPSYGTVEGLSFVGGEAGFPPVGVPLTVISSNEGPVGTATPYADYAFPPCFTPGTKIATPDGPRLVEEIAVGDLVLTRDAGPQPVVWIGNVHVDAARLEEEPAFRPIRLKKDALGIGRPNRDMHLSPQHRVLLTDWRAELLFGDRQVLAAAAHLVDGHDILPDPEVGEITYIHLFCDSHQILFADGLEAESFRPGPAALAGIDPAARAELLGLFPALAGLSAGEDSPMPACRRMLRKWETNVLTGQSATLCLAG